MTDTAGPRYVFADEDPTRHQRVLGNLSASLDPFTFRRLERAGVPPGARCLELGAGAGTVALWLAERVGPTGHVTATDLDVSAVPAHPRLTARVHDVTTDPLEPAQYHLIHARLLLAHLPSRREVLRGLVRSLLPGGALVVEEFAPSWDRCLLHSPDPDAQRLFTGYHHALMAVLYAAGTDPGWGRQVHPAMRSAGLVDVDAEVWARSWYGGEPGALLAYAAAGQLRDRLGRHGMPAGDVDRFRELLLDPELVILGNLAVSTTGRAVG